MRKVGAVVLRYTAMTFSTRELCSEADLAALQVEWDELLAASRANTIFLTYEWLSEWWAAYRPDASLRVVPARDAGGALAGIAPLMTGRVRVGPGIQVRTLQLLGDGSWDSDYLDWICRPGAEPEVVRALLDHIDGWPDWDVLCLNEVPVESPCLAAIRDECRHRRWRAAEARTPCAYTPLPRDWDAFLGSLKPRFRSKVRSLVRAVGGDLAAVLEYCPSASELDSWLEVLFDLHTRRWQSQGQDGVFGQPGKREFYRGMGRRFLERGWLRFSRLRMEDRVVAMQFCFEYANRTFLLQEGYDPAFADRDPGNTLRAAVFADNIRRGIDVYDFLGGVSQHKLNWGAKVKESARLTIARSTVRGRAFHWITHGGARLKERATTLAPAWMIRAAKRVLGRGTAS